MNKIVANIWLCFKRLKSNLLALAVGIIVLPVAIICYLGFTSVSPIGKIAIIEPDEQMLSYLNKNNIDYEIMNNRPKSALIMEGKYIGYIELDDGIVNYMSYSGIGKEEILEKIANRETIINQEVQSLFISIFPCILVIMFLQAVLNMKLYIEDRDNGMINRLRISNLRQETYLISQIIYNCIFMSIPAIITLLICKYTFNLSYELKTYQVISVIVITSIVSAAVALALCSIVRKNESAIMIGNVVAVISTLLSGVFGSNENIIFVSKIMPQNILMEWVQSFYSVSNGMTMSYVKISVIILVMLLVSLIVNKKIYWKN